MDENTRFGFLWKVTLTDLTASPFPEDDYFVYARTAFDAGKIALKFSPEGHLDIKSIAYVDSILLLDAKTVISKRLNGVALLQK